MAMSLASPSASPSPSTPNSTTAVKNESNTTTANDDTTPDTTTTNTTAAAAAAAAANIKRKPSRRANTAERRATHNAVERQRRETLNGRFLDLAALLPNLSQIRRPSKSSIVNSSIAHVHASRRHRLLASRELRQLRAEADALRREVNEWRSRANLPLVEEPVRSEGFNIIVSGELDVLVAEMGAEMAAQGHGNLVGVNGNGPGMMDVEDEEDIDDWGPAPPSSHGNPPPPSAGGYPGPGGQYDEDVFVPQPPVHPHHPHHPAQQQQQMMMNGGGHHHPMSQHHPHHPQQQQQQHHNVPPHIQHQGPFGYHPSQQQQQQQFAPGSLEEERHASFLKNGGNPFAHNIPRSYDSPPNGPGGALFTPPATRDGLPPNGVPGLTGPKINTNVGPGIVNGGAALSNGGASPAQSVHSVHSAHSPASHHSHPSVVGLNGDGTPPPQSAISTQFSGRSSSGSPVGYELSSGSGGGGGGGQPSMERRATYPGPGPAAMMGYPGEMYHHPSMGGHGHDMRGHEMRMHHPAMHGGHGGHPGQHHGGHHGGHGQMVGAGSGGGGLFGMMI